MSSDQDGCEWVSVSSGTGLPGPKAVKRLCVCVCVHACVLMFLEFVSISFMCLHLHVDLIQPLAVRNNKHSCC